MRRKLHFRRTTLLVGGLGACLIGLGLARTKVAMPWFVPLSFGFISAVHSKKKNLAALTSFILFGLALGWWRGVGFLPKLAVYTSLHNQKVELVGRAITDGVYGDRRQLEFELTDVTLLLPEQTKLVGTITVRGFGVPAVYRGDTLRVAGKLYQTRGSKQASISFADMAVLRRGTSVVDRLRLKFVAGLQTALPEPQASLGLGLLVGQRSTLPEEISEQLSVVGLTHIVAVSGYNLTILVQLALALLGKRSKYQTLMTALLLIITFLLLTGLSASIVRAAIVSGLSLLSWYYGRKVKPVLLILLAATGTALWYPPYLWSDIGWYLSFLAFFGVLVLTPLVVERRYGVKQKPHPLGMVLFESIAALLMTAPLIMYIFGQFSLIAFIANILVVPIVPIAMLLSAIAGVAGIVVPILSGWVSWPATLLLTYILDVVAVLHHVPGAVAKVIVDLPRIISMYAIIVFVCVLLWRKNRSQRIITETKLAE